ncbi:MAG: Gfo/Idh/MocA family oxidoreductase [Puniceicoccales bacterium]|jgi:predicted dehydrogenase|nr:Gfo/Idh/MocA family oxidoreductase [Puniceicoccales bacterium]
MSDTSVSLSNATFSRRRFLQKAGMALVAGAAFPTLIPARALGKDGSVAPSNRLTMGVIGTGQGWSDLQGFLGHRDVQAVAVCDVDGNERRRVANAIDGRYRTKGTKVFADFREMFDKANLDTVIVAPPDHWHAIIAIAAARSGIDIYGEKPLAHTLVEGRAIVNAVKQHGRVWQTGSWQRSQHNFFRAAELVRQGAIGKISHVQVGTLGTQNGFAASLSSTPNHDRIGKPPSHIDYDFWVGPSAWMEYDPRFSRYHWRWILNFGGGNLMDWVGHHVDIAHWALDFDDTGPAKISGTASYSTRKPWDAETTYHYQCTYANGQVIKVGSSYPSGTKFYGENGQWIYVDRGRLSASDSGILNIPPDPALPQLYRSQDHNRNFIDCVKNRGQTITHVESAHRSASVGHLGHIAVKTGRTINWDPVSETIKDDPSATAMLSPVYRAPWVL